MMCVCIYMYRVTQGHLENLVFKVKLVSLVSLVDLVHKELKEMMVYGGNLDQQDQKDQRERKDLMGTRALMGHVEILELQDPKGLVENLVLLENLEMMGFKANKGHRDPKDRKEHKEKRLDGWLLLMDMQYTFFFKKLALMLSISL